jgi:hypothetical protein
VSADSCGDLPSGRLAAGRVRPRESVVDQVEGNLMRRAVDSGGAKKNGVTVTE